MHAVLGKRNLDMLGPCEGIHGVVSNVLRCNSHGNMIRAGACVQLGVPGANPQ